jgi:hypothetical protein
MTSSVLFPVLHSDSWSRGQILCDWHFLWFVVRANYLVLLFESVHAKLLECNPAFDANVSRNFVPVYQ